MERVSRQAEIYLELYTPLTYGIALTKDEAQELLDAGLIEWVPPKFGSTQYNITLKGWEYRDKYCSHKLKPAGNIT